METKYLSCKDTAKLVREALKAAFPGQKFSVTSDTYAGGASIRVQWVDGPTVKEVDAVTDRYRRSDFDGMTDSTHYRGDTRIALPDGEVELVTFGADFVETTRDCSEAYQEKLRKAAQVVLGENGITGPFVNTGYWYESLGSDHGIFPGGYGAHLVWWLSQFVKPDPVEAPTRSKHTKI